MYICIDRDEYTHSHTHSDSDIHTDHIAQHIQLWRDVSSFLLPNSTPRQLMARDVVGLAKFILTQLLHVIYSEPNDVTSLST